MQTERVRTRGGMQSVALRVQLTNSLDRAGESAVYAIGDGGFGLAGQFDAG